MTVQRYKEHNCVVFFFNYLSIQVNIFHQIFTLIGFDRLLESQLECLNK